MEPEGEQPTPWERRGELGFFQGYWETWKAVMIAPEKFWDRTTPHGSAWDALAFGWIATAINSLLSLPFQLMQSTAQLRPMLDQMKATPEMERMMLWFFEGTGRFALLLGSLALYPVLFIIGAAFTHLMCMLFGVSRNGFTATVRALGYAAAPSALAWVPCVGAGAFIYTIVLDIWGLARLHRSTYGRAAAAVLAPIVLLFCCCCGAGIFAAMGLAGAAGAR
jgi:hypothetical protein